MRALLKKFEVKKEEPPPPPPKKERFQSELDAPRPELSVQAKTARVQSVSRVEAAKPVAEGKGWRQMPQIGATDTDEERELKRKIQAKEQEIVDVAAKLSALGDRLERALEAFHESVVGVAAAAPEAAPSVDRAKAFEDNENSPEKGKDRKSAPGLSGGKTSLEAILAAARSGKGRVKSETPKYAKLIRDMK